MVLHDFRRQFVKMTQARSIRYFISTESHQKCGYTSQLRNYRYPSSSESFETIKRIIATVDYDDDDNRIIIPMPKAKLTAFVKRLESADFIEPIRPLKHYIKSP